MTTGAAENAGSVDNAGSVEDAGPAENTGEIPETMRAVRLHSWGSAPTLDRVPVPRPGPGEVLLRVDAAGLCHSDLHIMDSADGVLPYELPFTLGHEVVGTVVAVGDRADSGWIGATCGVHGVWSCGDCRKCRSGRDNYCVQLTGPIGGGTGYDGGLADFMLVPSARHLVRVDPSGGPALAPLTDAGLTAYHAVVSQPVDPSGAIVVVVGIGGLGHLALQVLASRSPEVVVAVDPRESARELGLRLGAHHAVDSVDAARELVGRLSGDTGADLVLDFVGAPDTLDAARLMMATGAALVVVGSAGGALTVDKKGSVPRGWRVEAPFWGPHRHLDAVFDLAAAGGLSAVVEVRDLDDVLAAYEDLRHGRASGRLVVVP
ncbi:alcohol dehydrogenase catalytic domain-containing protein [Rhodococcus sp. IEGM 1408]|uniref:alcohol dehydrogenase catalytic domain-containing protein n=1 Tax=Rhodococcus sp. IEGM 1408 TaxID=3082220 RepID=UPI0029550C15|nr:alcohol dehydrogenase catalytic domain-containing protein [Rhodococcus sp. IEGM 1408]MDV8002630.1 alcohol dehydrogenase catalytic domain-containing protein [Rhodococcus sp. IEGM 1408]